MRSFLSVFAVVAALVVVPAATPAAAQPAEPVASTYTSVSPVRVLDTRTAGTPVGPQGSTTVNLSGRLPATATAVVLNVTGVAPTAGTYITAWPAGTPRPTASNLNLAAGEVRPNLVTVAVGANRAVSLYNNAGNTHLLADLAGYYSTGTGARFTGREAHGVGTSRIGARGVVDLDLSAYVPASATAVVLNLTGTRPTAGTYVTAWPSGTTRPVVSALNLAAGQTSANLVTVSIGAGRKVSLYNNAGTVDVISTLAGFYTPEYGAVFTPVAPTRVFDTRIALGTGFSQPQPIGARVPVTMLPGTALPDNAVSAVFNLTGVAPTAGTYLTMYQSDLGSLPTTSNLNLVTGQVASNLVVARIESQAPWTRTYVYNHAGSTHAVADLAGYFWVPPTDCATDCGVTWGENRTITSTGVGLNTDTTRPTELTGLSGVTAIAARAAVRSDGTVWTWGSNADGELGVGWRGGDSTIPLRVTGLTGATAVASGERATIALRSNGTVWAWGSNDRGLLGRTATAPSAVPVQVAGLSNVTAIAAKHGAAYALRADGTVWSWGVNTHGQLGRPGINPTPRPVPEVVQGVTGVEQVATSGYQTYAVRTDGTVLAWGANYSGELGAHTPETLVSDPVQVTGLTDVVAVAGHSTNGFAVRADGTVWAWGSGGFGVLGIEDACTELPGCATTEPVQVGGLDDIVDVAAMDDAVLALDENGQVHGWGGNLSGELAGAEISGIYTATPVELPNLSGVTAIEGGFFGGRALRS